MSLSLAKDEGIIMGDVDLTLGFLAGNKTKMKVDIPLNGKPIYGFVKTEGPSYNYVAKVYFIIEEEEENETK